MSRARTSPADGERSEPGARASGAGSGLEAAVQRFFAPQLETPRGARLARAWQKTLRLLRPLGAVTRGNRVQVLCDGDQVFEALWSAIAGAERSVLLNTYIFEPDRVGRRTLEELTRAAGRGCQVLLVLDAFGSHRLGEADLAALRAAGGRVLFFNPIVRWRSPLSRLVRNHRKIVVVDRALAFCGGMNIAEEYAGPRHGTGLFRDTQLRLEGPCARDLAEMVERLAGAIEERRPGWRAALERLARPAPAGGAAADGGTLVQILESSVRRERRAIQKALRTTLARSLERCTLTSPYFVPPKRLMRALIHAARRGVDVRILTAGRSDVPSVRLAGQHLYGRLLRSGVRIFELTGAVLHAKTAVIDGVFALVGSFNLDYWSDRRNLEVSVGVLDRSSSAALEEQFRLDLEGAREVTLESWGARPWLQRALGWLAYQVLRI